METLIKRRKFLQHVRTVKLLLPLPLNMAYLIQHRFVASQNTILPKKSTEILNSKIKFRARLMVYRTKASLSRCAIRIVAIKGLNNRFNAIFVGFQRMARGSKKIITLKNIITLIIIRHAIQKQACNFVRGIYTPEYNIQYGVYTLRNWYLN